MTEAEWLVCEQCGPLLSVLQTRGSDRQRKLRLFGVACCLSNSDLFPDARLLHGLSVAEKLADKCAGEREVTEAEDAVLAVDELDFDMADGSRRTEPIISLLSRQVYAADDAAGCARRIGYMAECDPLGSFLREEVEYENCRILREIFGNPFRPLAFAPAWRTTDVTLLARGIYEEKAFDRMPILADALQDAGCDNDDILAHCRDSHVRHVRGCWALDAVLGKE